MVASSNQEMKNLSCTHSSRFNTSKIVRILKRIFPQERWTKDKLHREVKISGAYVFPHGSIRYVGQPKGPGTEHEWEITVDREWMQARLEAYFKANAQEQGITRAALIWNGILLGSTAELEIAEALQRKGILFFPKARCCLRNQEEKTETWETDFLVVCRGIARILQVDDMIFNQNISHDYKRDRRFDREGIRTSRFSASECLKDADKVVEEFLELFNPNTK